VDHENLTALWAIMGSDGKVVLDEDTCMVDVAKSFVSFCMGESSRLCAPCREGAREMVRLLDDITQGKGTPEHVAALDELCLTLMDRSLCGLGRAAPNPVLSTLRHFRHEYDAHIHDKRCPAGVCKPLITFSIDSSECMGCMLCARNCPQKGITGDKGGRRFHALARAERKKAPTIEQAACIKCGTCFETCPFGAVKKA
jgi:ferredoxin